MRNASPRRKPLRLWTQMMHEHLSLRRLKIARLQKKQASKARRLRKC